MATATATKAKLLKVYPLADRVAIRPMEETETMKGGLYIPDTAKEKPIQGAGAAAGTASTAVHKSSSRVKRSSSSKKPTSLPSWAEALGGNGHACKATGIQHRGPRAVEARRGPAGRGGQGDARPQGSECRHR